MAYKYILFEKKGNIATISLNTPENYNALAVENLNEVYDALEICENNPSVRVIIFTAKGKMFSSGGNVKEFLSAIKEDTASQKIADISEILHKCVLKIMAIEKPVVGKIRGGAYGAGLNLVLSCDLVYAEETAILDEAFANIGLSIDGGGTYTIPRMIGMKKSKEFFWLGQIDAKRAQEWGLINGAIPESELDQVVENVVKHLAALPPLNIICTKKLVNSTYLNTVTQQLELERQIQIKVAASQDFTEGVTALIEKRKPTFIGK